MRMLILGSDKVYAIENHYVKYLKAVGVEVELFPASSIFHDYYYQFRFWNKIKYRLGVSSILKRINLAIIKKAEEFLPTVVLVFKGMEVYPETLEHLKRSGIFLANYNPDNPLKFTGRGSGNKNITESISLYDLHFTYNFTIAEQLVEKFQATVEMLPFGYELNDEVYQQIKDFQEINRICFLGNPDPDRLEQIKALISAGLPLDLYGNGWDKLLSGDSVQTYPAVYSIEFWKTLIKYRVQLNLLRVHNPDSHNMRSFEIPAVGAIQLAPATREHIHYFQNEKEGFFYQDFEECINYANNLLKLSKEEAKIIRENARAACIEREHSYKERAQQLLSKLLHHQTESSKDEQ